MTSQYDFFVIGAGSGGVRAARVAASLGARVGICEEKDLGGTCVNAGCIPKKLFVYASRFRHEFSRAADFGWKPTLPEFDWTTLVANKNREIARLNGVYEKLLRDAGVDIFVGRGEIASEHSVRVAGQQMQCDTILVATGGRPSRPAVPGAELVLSSDDIFHLSSLPKSIAIYGGGYISCEFAGVFHNLGIRTQLVHRGERLLRGFDDDVRSFVGDRMAKAGVELHLGRTLSRIENAAGVKRATLDDESAIEADAHFAAIGRVPNSAGIGLERVGVELGPRDAIVVNERFQTSVPSIYAVGDVIDRVALTPVALAEGTVVARSLFGDQSPLMRYDYIPTAVFSQPEVGTVGLTEHDARAKLPSVRIFRSSFTPLKETLAPRDTDSVDGTLSVHRSEVLVKLVVDGGTDRVVGCHMVGSGAAEIVQGLAVAIQAGATKAVFDATLGIHPTTAEEFVSLRTPIADNA